MLIRPENEADFPVIYDLVETAFKTAKVSNSDEQNFVNRLRASEHYIPELALVAEDKEKLIGHVMLTRMQIETERGPYSLLLLGPLAVVLECRGQKVGARLVDEVCSRARKMGHTAIVLVGDPDYYQRFGFRPSIDFGIENANEIPSQYVMALELTADALKGIKGVADFHA